MHISRRGGWKGRVSIFCIAVCVWINLSESTVSLARFLQVDDSLVLSKIFFRPLFSLLFSSLLFCLVFMIFKTPSIVLLQAYVRPLFGRPIPCYVIKPQAWLNSLRVLFTYCCISLWLPFLPSCLFLYSSFVFSSSSPLYLAFSLFFHFSFLISYLFSFLHLSSLLI